MIEIMWKMWSSQLLLCFIEKCQCYCQKDQKAIFETMKILLAAYGVVLSGKSYRNFSLKPFLRFKSLATHELNPEIWTVVGSTSGKPDVWVPICVCLGMPWFQGSKSATSSGTPDLLGWCSQNIWVPVQTHNERASTSGEIPKSMVWTCKLITGWAANAVWLFPSTDSICTGCGSLDVTHRAHWCSWAWYLQAAIEYAMVISRHFLISPLFKVIVLTQSPPRQGEKYFPNNYCS